MGFSRQEYWSGLPFPPPGHLPDPGIKPRSSNPGLLYRMRILYYLSYQGSPTREERKDKKLQDIGNNWQRQQWVLPNKSFCVVTKLCPTLYNPIDCSPPGSSVHGISQARMLEWVAISFSRALSLPRNRIRVPCIGRQFFTIEPPAQPQCSLYKN